MTRAARLRLTCTTVEASSAQSMVVGVPDWMTMIASGVLAKTALINLSELPGRLECSRFELVLFAAICRNTPFDTHSMVLRSLPSVS
jgi:hypothetical protein